MRAFQRLSAGATAVISLVIGLAAPMAVHAATAPSLGAADGYSAFGKAGVTNTGAGTHLWGNVGADATNVTGLAGSQVDGTIDAGAGVEAAILTAYGALAGQGADGALSLSGTVTAVPGTWTVGAALMNGAITLDGAGVYIFRSSSDITATSAAQMSLINGATACNVFFQVPDAMTIDTGAHIEGTIITDTELVSLATGATLKGRAFSRIAQVTLDTNQVTNPCAAAPVGAQQATINVVKRVINDQGGTKTIADFSLFVNGTPVSSGMTNVFPAITGVYTVTETNDPTYTRTFSGDCDANGSMNLTQGQNKFCIVTNNDIGAPVVVPPVPPLIDVVKVPSPLSLPAGPGSVLYTYTTRNIGTVPMTNVTLVGDTCSPIVLVSGDTNGDATLQMSETWTYQCTTTLAATHTNTVVATGWANGISATDIASATVVVGLPLVPPLIHVTKVPSPLALLAGGGMVTYTKKVTNPGTVPMSNVSITDDMCGPVVYVSGDTDSDLLLDTTETWTFTCQSNLTATTTNTATATGQANGFTARDIAIATVVVATAVPVLPITGFGPAESALASSVVAAIILAATLLLYALYIRQKKQSV